MGEVDAHESLRSVVFRSLLLMLGVDEELPLDLGASGVLVVVLRWQGVGGGNADLVAATGAAVDAGVWCSGAGRVHGVECRVVALGEMLSVFVERHGFLSLLIRAGGVALVISPCRFD